MTLSVASCRAALPVCLPILSTRRLARTSLRYRQGLARTHCQACFAPLSTSTLRRQSCHLTAAAPTTRSRALRFCASCTPSPRHSSRSCASGIYGQQSTYFWWDQDGQRRTIHQGEGCEQGDALAPALYALGQHDALVAADEQLRPGECLAAFLDDVYLVTTPSRAREALDVVTSSGGRHR